MSDRILPMNNLYHRAMKLADRDIPEEELREEDITELYYEEKPKMIKNGELLNVQFNGLPGSGKSVAMLAEVMDTNNILKKPTTNDHILPNQIIYAQIMRRFTKRADICIGIDEFDKMGETGHNATTDNAILEHYSDLHRAHYIHKYACAPKDQIDKNSFLVFEVQGPDKKLKYTRCLLYYRIFSGGLETLQLLGYVDIDVKHVLGTKFYKEYEHRKHARLKMIGKYGIQNDRDIIFGEIVLESYNKLKKLAILGTIDNDMIEMRILVTAREMKQINSMLTGKKFVSNVRGLLMYDLKIEKLKKELKKLKKQAEQDSKIQALIPDFVEEIETIAKDKEENIKYWEKAASLKSLYFSHLGESGEFSG